MNTFSCVIVRPRRGKYVIKEFNVTYSFGVRPDQALGLFRPVSDRERIVFLCGSGLLCRKLLRLHAVAQIRGWLLLSAESRFVLGLDPFSCLSRFE